MNVRAPGRSFRETHVVVGAGESGVAAVAAMRAVGFAGQVILIGGECQFPYGRPPLSKDALLCEGTVVPQEIRPRAFFDEHGIELRLGEWVEDIDPVARRVRVRTAAGIEWLAFDRLLLATGGQARRLPVLDDCGAFYLRTLKDAAALRLALAGRQSALVMGGGVIGLELASAARMLGLRVSVIEVAPRLMPRGLAPELSTVIAHLHEINGVNLKLGNSVERISKKAGEYVALLLDGSEARGEIVLAGIGLEPDVTLAKASGCAIDNGILVDGHGRTSVDGIFAAGDVARFVHPLFNESMRLEAWQHARLHGAHVGRAMAGETATYREVPWFWTDQHGRNIQIGGMPALADTSIRRGVAGATWFHLRRHKIVGVTTIDNGKDMRPALNLIAAGREIDAGAFADPKISLRSLLASENSGAVYG